jgi:hypothetical protein
MDGDPLLVIAVNDQSANVGTAISLPSGATLSLNADGSLIYEPPVGFVGQDSFAYTVSDGIDVSTASVLIDVTNEVPNPGPDAYSVLHDHTLATYVSQFHYGVLYNDIDMNGDSLTVTKVNGNASAIGNAFVLPNGATVTMNASGTFTYTPVSGFVGQDSFSYTVSDSVSTSIGTVTIAITNQPPVAQPDEYSTGYNQALNILAANGLLFNDSDMDGDPLEVTKVNGVAANVGTTITLASGASLRVEVDGSFTYTPATGFTGIDSFTYEIWDGVELALATVYIDVSIM